jgi:hypothetical protein
VFPLTDPTAVFLAPNDCHWFVFSRRLVPRLSSKKTLGDIVTVPSVIMVEIEAITDM